MRGHVFTVVALLLLLLAAMSAAFQPMLAFGVIVMVFLAALGLLVFRWRGR